MNQIKRKVKNKIFHDRRCRMLCIKSKWKVKKSVVRQYITGASKRVLLHAPKELSIFDDTSTSVKFFNDVINTIKRCAVKTTLYFDLSEVEIITPDAVMYLLAIIKNTKRLRMLDISCEGNMPVNQKAREVFQQTGFFRFVYAHYRQHVQESSNLMKIVNGTAADGEVAGSFCDFVQESCQKKYTDTKRLYPVIVELMTNTYQHAYRSDRGLDGHTNMYANWYIFAQDVGAAIRFIFLDTGVGIPQTVAKRFREVFKDWFNNKNDAVYLESVLTGDYGRSETGLNHRGKGLPGIYEDCQNSYIRNLKIISGKAKCLVGSDSAITAEGIEAVFQGTLFSWEILK